MDSTCNVSVTNHSPKRMYPLYALGQAKPRTVLQREHVEKLPSCVFQYSPQPGRSRVTLARNVERPYTTHTLATISVH